MSVAVGAGVGAGLAAVRTFEPFELLEAGLDYDQTTNSLTVRLVDVSGETVAETLSIAAAGWIPAEALISPELGDQSSLGPQSGGNQNIMPLAAPLTIGRWYLIEYTVTANDGTGRVFPNSTSPFNGGGITGTNFPHEVGGPYRVITQAKSAATISSFRTNGNITIEEGSVKACSWSATLTGASEGDKFAFTITRGKGNSGAAVRVPGATDIHVETTGSDTLGTGALASPFRTPERADTVAGPGSVMKIGPGTFAPFAPQTSGTSGNPVIWESRLGGENKAVIEGTLLTDVVYGGPGGQESDATRDGIYVLGKDWLTFRNLKIRNCHWYGIGVIGVAGQQHGNVFAYNNDIEMTGASSICFSGMPIGELIAANEVEPSELRLRYVGASGNKYRKHNVVNDKNTANNTQGIPGGVDEGITITAGVANGVFQFNHQDAASRQYGIDAKAGVRSILIAYNIIDEPLRFGVYVDASSAFAIDIDVFGNVVTGADIGFAIARENFRKERIPILRNVRMWNNTARNCRTTGFFLQNHPQDVYNGEISGVEIAFNTSVDAARGGSGKEFQLTGWDTQAYRDGGVIQGSGVKIWGNLAWRSDGPTDAVMPDDGDGFSIGTGNGNFNGGDVDPLFEDAANGDLRLQAISPFIDAVTGAGETAAPYNIGLAENARVAGNTASGAYAP